MKYFFVDFPAFYTLNFDVSKFELEISIRPDCFKEIVEIVKPDTPLLSWYTDTPFTLPGKHNWAYDKILKWKGLKPWPTWTCKLLPIHTKKDWNPIGEKTSWSISQSFSILTSLLFPDKDWQSDTTSSTPQLLTLDVIIARNEMHGGSLSATISTCLQNWIINNPNVGKQIEEVMFKTFTYLWKDYNPHPYEFRYSEMVPGRFHLTVPGNACGLDPSNVGDDRNKPYSLEPHNVDTRLQQLTFLSALAWLYGTAWKDITKTHIQ
jgi:hypothetical protein